MQASDEITKLKKRVSDFISNFNRVPSISPDDRSILAELQKLLADTSYGDDILQAYDKFETDIAFIFAVEYKRTITVKKKEQLQKRGFFGGLYIEEILVDAPEEQIYEPSIKKPLGFLLGNIRVDLQSYKESLAKEKPKPGIEEGPTLADIMRTMQEMDAQHKSDATKTQHALDVAGQALNKVQEQLEYMKDASANALLALPSNVRSVALAATGGQDSKFALAIRDRLAAAETSEPKKDLNTLLTPVYNGAQGQNNIRFRIRFVQLLLRLYPRTLFLSDIIDRAAKLFTAIGLQSEKDDLVDGFLQDFQFKKDHIDNTPLSQQEISDFCEFARDADFGFDEETVRSFSTVNFNKTSEVEGIEKKVRLQFIRNFEKSMAPTWLEGKHEAVKLLTAHYTAHRSKDVDALAIKYLLYQLLLHKNDLTISVIVKEAKEFFAKQNIPLTVELKECLDSDSLTQLNDEISKRPLSIAECEIFDAMISRLPFNLLLRSDPVAQKLFANLSLIKDPENEMAQATEEMEASYKRTFLSHVDRFIPKAPLNFHAEQKQASVAPASAAVLQEQTGNVAGMELNNGGGH